MSNPRDTQFAGFAKLLLEEFCIDSIHSIELGTWEEIIAQRAYDLVGHVVQTVDILDLDRLFVEEIIAKVPDLAQWPEEHQ